VAAQPGGGGLDGPLGHPTSAATAA
jgi:hypothetical protein